MLMEDVMEILKQKYKELSEYAGGLLKGFHARMFRALYHQRIVRGKLVVQYTQRFYEVFM